LLRFVISVIKHGLQQARIETLLLRSNAVNASWLDLCFSLTNARRRTLTILYVLAVHLLW
ncbi:hypothetical protein, partial [Vibrio nigripulchritudo]|uniref:hypothetical protein n=1 Tax=Vibrio nigripulchritudo TaxID=28173 RepID=UPI001A7E4988